MTGRAKRGAREGEGEGEKDVKVQHNSFAPFARDASTRSAFKRLSEARVLERLRLSELRTPLAPDELREAKLVAFVLFATSQGDIAGAYGAEDGLRLFAEESEIASLSGLGRGVIAGALARLERAGVVRRSEEAAALVISSSVLEDRSSLVEVPAWSWVLGRVGGEPASLLVAWAMAELLRHPSRWSSVKQRDLAEYSGYSKGQVIRAVARLVEQGVLEMEGGNGRVSAYRFSAVAMGRQQEPSHLKEHGERFLMTPAQAHGGGERAEEGGRTQRPSSSGDEGTGAQTEGESVQVSVAGLSIRVPRGTEVVLEKREGGGRLLRIDGDVLIGPF